MDDHTYIEALYAAPSTGTDRTLQEAVADAQPRFAEAIHTISTLYQSLVRTICHAWTHIVRPAMIRLARALGLLPTSRPAPTQRILRMAQRRCYLRAKREQAS